MLVDRPVRELLDAFSSSAPTPGGGSAAALSSAVGASLLLMVASLPKTRSNSEEDRAALASAADALRTVREQLTAAIDADTAAYNQVVAAYKLPKGTADEQLARKAAIQTAMNQAIDVPLDVMRMSALTLGIAAEEVAAHALRSASSDVGVALALLQAGIAGAKLNVEINLESIADEASRATVRRELRSLMEVVDGATALAEAGLRAGV